MVIGKINFNTGKFAGKFSVDWDNWVMCLKDYYFETHHFILKCRLCGQLLAPVVQQVGPYNCGWKKDKGGWICHQCYYHGGLEGTEKEIKDYKRSVHENNKKIKRELRRYTLFHPWGRFKKI